MSGICARSAVRTMRRSHRETQCRALRAAGARLAWQRRQELGESEFTFAGDDDVGAGVEIFRDVVGALGAAEHHRPAMQLRGADDRSTLRRVMRLV